MLYTDHALRRRFTWHQSCNNQNSTTCTISVCIQKALCKATLAHSESHTTRHSSYPRSLILAALQVDAWRFWFHWHRVFDLLLGCRHALLTLNLAHRMHCTLHTHCSHCTSLHTMYHIYRHCIQYTSNILHAPVPCTLHTLYHTLCTFIYTHIPYICPYCTNLLYCLTTLHTA